MVAEKRREQCYARCAIVSMQVAAIAFASIAGAVELSPKYLDGVWTLDSKEN